MMCPQCGNTDFTGIDTSKVFVCPVAGCGLKIDPDRPAYIRIRAEAPVGSFFARNFDQFLDPSEEKGESGRDS